MSLIEDGPKAVACVEELDQLKTKLASFVDSIGETGDDFVVWCRRSRQRGVRFHEGAASESSGLHAQHGEIEQVVVRAYVDDRHGEVLVQNGEPWEAAVKRALEKAKQAEATGTLPLLGLGRSSPVTFDFDLNDSLISGERLYDIGYALFDNTRHEASRDGGLHQLDGYLFHRVTHVAVGRRDGVQGASCGLLDSEIEINGLLGDSCLQIAAADSFQSLALSGARAWRSAPQAMSELPNGRFPALLHPRVLEELFRVLAAPVFLKEPNEESWDFDEVPLTAARGVTIVEDSGENGLAMSRAFDDLGVACRRRPLILNGCRIESVHPPAAWRAPLTADDFNGNPAYPKFEPRFGSLTVQWGPLEYQDMYRALDVGLMIQRIENLRPDPDVTTGFKATVRWAQFIKHGETFLIEPHALEMRGRLLAPLGEGSVLGDVVFSHEFFDTGTSTMPFGLCFLDFAPLKS